MSEVRKLQKESLERVIGRELTDLEFDVRCMIYSGMAAIEQSSLQGASPVASRISECNLARAIIKVVRETPR